MEENEMQALYQLPEYVSHTEKPVTFFEKVYFFIRKRMIKRKMRYIEDHIKGKPKILDYGCGTGEFLKKCIEKNWNAFGFEPGINASKIAQKKTKINIMIKCEELKQFSEKPLDVITLWHVIEHVADPGKTMTCLNNILKKNGLLVLAVPNYESYDARHYKEEWAGFDVPRHLYHFNDKAIKILGEKYGFQLINKKPLIFDSFFISLISEKKSNTLIKLLKATVIGFISNLYGLLKIKPYSSQAYFFKKK